LIGILHASALRKRKELQDITKKNKKKQDFKNFPGIRQKLNFANYFFQNENSQNFV